MYHSFVGCIVGLLHPRASLNLFLRCERRAVKSKMVVPIDSGPSPQMSEELPQECREDLEKVKYAVLLMIASGIGRGVSAAYLKVFSLEFFPLINLFCTIVMGTFILKDDEHLKGFYECLVSSICPIRAGGVRCLLPFVMFTGVDFVLDLLLKFQALKIMPYGIFLAGSIAAQGIGCWYGWIVYKRIRDDFAGALDTQGMGGAGGGMGGMGGMGRWGMGGGAGSGGPLGGTGGGYEMAGGPAPPSSANAQAPPQQHTLGGDRPPGSQIQGAQGFSPFQGQGQRLGS